MSELKDVVNKLCKELDRLFHTPDLLHREQGYPNLAELLASINAGIHRAADALDRMNPPPQPPPFVPEGFTDAELLAGKVK